MGNVYSMGNDYLSASSVMLADDTTVDTVSMETFTYNGLEFRLFKSGHVVTIVSDSTTAVPTNPIPVAGWVGSVAGVIPVGYRPVENINVDVVYNAYNGTMYICRLSINKNGAFNMGQSAPSGGISNLQAKLTTTYIAE